MAAKILRLKCDAQQYAWGKLGLSSKVAELAASTPGVAIDESKPYAELWMGTHPNAPSKVFETNQALGELIKSDPSLTTADLHRAYDGDLPFLLKVLSVKLALSIQAHPNKTLAKKLFETRPDVYKDPNHKPEMALALTPFEALCGFRPLAEIAEFLEQYPEFRAVVGEEVSKHFVEAVRSGASEPIQRAGLKSVFGALMRADSKVVEENLAKLIDRIGKLPKGEQVGVKELVTRLNDQFPKDVGCFCVFVLNFMTLQPGEAIFLAANLPHAYISGDCVECMATSDNVVRAGLTPKLRDVETLVTMLDYNYGPSSEFVIAGSHFQGSKTTQLFNPPVPEFSVLRTVLPEGQSESFEGIKGPSILIVTSGKGTLESESHTHKLDQGFVYFIPAGVALKLTADSELTSHRAYCDATA